MQGIDEQDTCGVRTRHHRETADQCRVWDVDRTNYLVSARSQWWGWVTKVGEGLLWIRRDV